MLICSPRTHINVVVQYLRAIGWELIYEIDFLKDDHYEGQFEPCGILKKGVMLLSFLEHQCKCLLYLSSCRIFQQKELLLNTFVCFHNVS